MIIEILLSILIGILLTSLIVIGVVLAVCCIEEFIYFIRGCIAEFQHTKSINWCQICFDIITVISLLGTVALISTYMYFQL